MSSEMQRAIAAACLRARAGEEIARDLPGFLERCGVAMEDVGAVAAASPLVSTRLAVYRSLVRNGLSAVVLRVLPRTRRHMNAVCAGRFDRDLATFVDAAGPRTHYLRDVPAEFFAWIEASWRADASLRPYLPDLAAHEIATLGMATADSPLPLDETVEIALDRALAFIEPIRLVRYEHAVHELFFEEEGSPTDEPPRREVFLLGYRDGAHDVHWLELTPFASSVLAGLLAKRTLGGAVARACDDHCIATAKAVPEAARLLARLGENGVLRGAILA